MLEQLRTEVQRDFLEKGRTPVLWHLSSMREACVLSPAPQIRGEKRKQVGEDACSQAYNWAVPGGRGNPPPSAGG